MLQADVEGREPPIYTPGLLVGRGTRLVNEGLMHLLKAMDEDPSIRLPESLNASVREVITDLQDYVHQDFKAFPVPDLAYSLKSVGYAAILVLCRLAQVEDHQLNNMQLEVAADLVEKLQTRL
jgi:hypothetical protein